MQQIGLKARSVPRIPAPTNRFMTARRLLGRPDRLVAALLVFGIVLAALVLLSG